MSCWGKGRFHHRQRKLRGHPLLLNFDGYLDHQIDKGVHPSAQEPVEV